MRESLINPLLFNLVCSGVRAVTLNFGMQSKFLARSF